MRWPLFAHLPIASTSEVMKTFLAEIDLGRRLGFGVVFAPCRERHHPRHNEILRPLIHMPAFTAHDEWLIIGDLVGVVHPAMMFTPRNDLATITRPSLGSHVIDRRLAAIVRNASRF